MAIRTMLAALVRGLPLRADPVRKAAPRLVSPRVRLGTPLGTVAALAVAIPTLLHAP